MFTHIHISWSPSAARSHFKVLMLYLEYQLLMFHSDIYTDLKQNIMPQYIQGTFYHNHHYSRHDYLCQSHSRVWSSILPQLHQTNQTLPVSLASPGHSQNYDDDDNNDGHDYIEDCDEGDGDGDLGGDDDCLIMLLTNLREPGVTKTMTMVII